MTNRYDDRKLYSVRFHDFALQETDGEPLVGAALTIGITSQDGDQLGPGIELLFGVPASPELSLEELRNQAFNCAYDLLQRIAKETKEDLRTELMKAPLFSAIRE